MPDPNQLVVVDEGDDLKVLGLANASFDLKPLIGSMKPKAAATLSRDEAAEKLASEVMQAVGGGKEVIDGYVKFARPITIKNGALKGRRPGVAKQASAGSSLSQAASYEIDESAREYLDAVAAGDFEKAAAHPFHDRLVEAIEAEKVDPSEVGLTFDVPVKIAFSNDGARRLFMGIGRRSKKAAHDAVDALVKSGSITSPFSKLADEIEREPGKALVKIAARYVVALKQGDRETADVLTTILGRLRAA